MNQVKKDDRDPDFDKINPDIVKIAQTNGFVRQPLELYLTGKLSWMEALEAMVTTVYGQFKDQQNLLTEVLSSRPATALLLSVDTGPLLKALPRHPYTHEEETTTIESVHQDAGDSDDLPRL